MASVVSVVRSMVAPVTRTRWFRRSAPVWMPPIERAIQWVSHGRLQLSALLVPSLVLHSIGARSGCARDTELMYTPDGHGRAIVAGTSFAREKHPGWTYNLLANPNASITVRGLRMPVLASQLEGTERDAAWRLIEAQWPGYRAYERDSGRTVRLFRLTLVVPE